MTSCSREARTRKRKQTPHEVVNLDLVAEATTYHHLSISREFDAGFTAVRRRQRVRRGTAADEQLHHGAEVSVLGEVAFYSQYDWYGRRYFLDVSKAF